MSIEAYKAAWDTDCTGSAKLLLLAMADFASDKNNFTCTASIDTLAEMTGTSKRHVKRTITTLEELGLVQIERGHGRSNTHIYSLYQLVKGDTMSPNGETEKVTFDTEKVTFDTVKGDTMSPEPLLTKEPLVDDIEILEKHFTFVSGILPGKSNYDFAWKEPLQMYLDNAGSIDKAKTRIEKAIGIARGESENGKTYNIASPRSLATIIANMPDEVSKAIRISAI